MSVVPDFKRHQWFLLLAKSRIPDAAWERIQESTKDGTEYSRKGEECVILPPVLRTFPLRRRGTRGARDERAKPL